MAERALTILPLIEDLVAVLARHGYRMSAASSPEALTAAFEHAGIQQRIIVRASAPALGTSHASVTVLNARNRQIDAEDWLVANGLAGAVRFKAQKAELHKAFFAAFAADIARILAGPMGEILSGEAWSEPPADWRGLRHRDTF